jgi:two-component system, NarL family, response regulator DevR
MRGYVAPLLRVYLLDDHDIVRRGLHDLLDTKADIQIVGDSGSARDATRRIQDLKPDVMVLDVQLPDGSGVQVCREVRSADPSIRGVLLTSYEDHEAAAAAILAGAAGYVLKLAGSLDIIDAIRRVGAGRSLLQAAETERAMARLRARLKEVSPAFTDQEQQIMTHVIEGLTNRQIAERLGVADALRGDDVAGLIDRLSASTGDQRRFTW